ncbi:MAG: glutamate synthase subunit beta [Lachnospiraceae bacterium]|jgi:glutamate synthase (NADPH/NADH) small chain
MGKPTGFLEYQREDNFEISPERRTKNFYEFHNPLNEEERRRQGARCMNCGVPFCQSAMKLHGMVTGCPLHNLIPEWNDYIYKNHIWHALSRLLKTSDFPEFTGRVCPALCEKACTNGQDSDPVTIRDNELYLIESAFAQGYIQPMIPAVRSGRRVAVVGSGPSGLAVANELNHRGHSVTVFERDDRVGGLLMYGIPNMKLDKKVIERRRKLMEQEGVVFKTGVNVGVDVTAQELQDEYDAVVLCCGAKQARSLQLEGAEGASGISYAVDFLSGVTKSLLNSNLKDSRYIPVRNKDVVIVGGGDTGNDCIGTVIRLGCRSVTAIEMMPKPPAERAEDNPWPEWPKTLKTDYGHQEAIWKFGHDPRIFSTTVKKAYTEKGVLKGIQTVQVKMEGRTMKEIPGTEKDLGCDLLLIAAGFTGCEKYTADAFGVRLTKRNAVATQPDRYSTDKKGIFTAGDMHRGQSLVVWAVAEGRACAREVDEYLMGYTTMN